MSMPSRSATESRSEIESPKAPPALPCSDCKTILRSTYFVMNERPVCPKCRGEYKAKVERGTGPAALMRAVMYGGGASLACALGFTIILSMFGGLRAVGGLLGAGVAILVAKAIGNATGEYGGRRYQWLAVGFTYLAISLGAMAPVLRLAYKINHVKMPPRSASHTGPQGEAAEIRDELHTAVARENEDPAVTAARADSLARVDSLERMESERARLRKASPDASFATRVSGGFTSIVFGAIALFFVLPILSSFSYGLYAGVLVIFAFIYGLKRAWDMTGLVTDYQLSGPFRVGAGPIAPTIGG
jgi:hypothetical protein